MYKVERSALVTHSAEDMFILVNDVASYSEFLPWCGGSEELSRAESEVIGKVTIDFKGIKKSFTTRNELFPYHKTILNLVDGPFSDLKGFWEFKPLDDTSCKIMLSLNFDFSSKLVGKVVGPIFETIANSMVDSFCKRADQIYGK